VGALAPDLDAEASTLKRKLGLAGTVLSAGLSLLGVIRRGATHFGLTALTILALTWLGDRLGWPWGYGDVGLAFGLGYLSHVLAGLADRN